MIAALLLTLHYGRYGIHFTCHELVVINWKMLYVSFAIVPLAVKFARTAEAERCKSKFSGNENIESTITFSPPLFTKLSLSAGDTTFTNELRHIEWVPISENLFTC